MCTGNFKIYFIIKENLSMEKYSKIYVAGHSGLVGSAIVRKLEQEGYTNILKINHHELDLTRQSDVESFFCEEKPEYVFLCAAKVGGIHANEISPAEFMYDNLTIETNIIHSAYKTFVRKLLFMGSGCIYPRIVPQPIKEEYLLTAPLEKTNEAYAIAKIAGLKMCEFYNRQYKTDYISVMPCNLYGPGDNYHPENSHVIPALLRKFHEAKLQKTPQVTLWGTGNAMREFMHIDDIADASYFLMNHYSGKECINIGCGKDMKISALGELIKSIVGYDGKIVYDTTMPDGTPRKLLDSEKLFSMGWRPKIELRNGLEETYKDYILNCYHYRR